MHRVLRGVNIILLLIRCRAVVGCPMVRRCLGLIRRKVYRSWSLSHSRLQFCWKWFESGRLASVSRWMEIERVSWSCCVPRCRRPNYCYELLLWWRPKWPWVVDLINSFTHRTQTTVLIRLHNPLTPAVVIWIQLWSTVPDRVSRHLWFLTSGHSDA